MEETDWLAPDRNGSPPGDSRDFDQDGSGFLQVVRRERRGPRFGVWQPVFNARQSRRQWRIKSRWDKVVGTNNLEKPAMSRVSRLLPVLLGVVLIDPSLTLGPVCRSKALGAEAPRPFAVFVDDYFNAAFDARPSMGTAEGLHQYDDRLEDGSADGRRETDRSRQNLPGPARQASCWAAHRGRVDRRRGPRRPDQRRAARPRDAADLAAQPDELHPRAGRIDRRPDEAQLRSARDAAALGHRPAQSRSGNVRGAAGERRQSAQGVHRPGDPHGLRLDRLLSKDGPRLGPGCRRK